MAAEKIMEIRVQLQEALQVQGKKRKIVMIPFTGEAKGPNFTGRVVSPGVDTQTISWNGALRLSARYMLEGTDGAGNPCRVFIENEGSWDAGFRPRIVTDSPLLQALEDAPLTATVEGIPGGVLVSIFQSVQQEE